MVVLSVIQRNSITKQRKFMTTKLWITLSLGLLISACGDGSRPMSPTAPTPSESRPTYTVSGVVSAEAPTGIVQIQGVRVRLEEGSFRQDAMTDGNGFYALSGVSPGNPSITLSKDTYDIETRRVTINSDTRLDIRISRRVSYTLSGIVYELSSSGRVPIEGVEVYCDGCGSEVGHTFAYTNASGFYSFGWAYNGVIPLLVRKTGYQVVNPGGTFPDGTGTRHATVNGDTTFDIQVAPR